MEYDLQRPEMERVGCSFCGADRSHSASDGAIAWKGETLSYRVCLACGLKYMDWRPTRGWYAYFYSHEFWQSKTEQGKSSAVDQHKDWQDRRVRRIERVLSGAADLSTVRRAIEIGASWGRTLATLRSRYNWRVAAVEPSRLAQRHLHETLGIELVGSVLEDLENRTELAGQFDLILMSHVLENTLDPMRSLRIARELLRDGGYLFIDTPNIYYNDLVNPYHPFIFFPETLNNMLAVAGLRTIKIDRAPNPSGLPLFVDPRKTAYLGVVAARTEAPVEQKPVDVRGMLARQRGGVAAYRRSMQLGQTLRKKPWRDVPGLGRLGERLRPLG